MAAPCRCLSVALESSATLPQAATGRAWGGPSRSHSKPASGGPLRAQTAPDTWVIEDLAQATSDGLGRIYRASPQSIEVRADNIEGGTAVVIREPAGFRTRR